jgi:hypothetical protein
MVEIGPLFTEGTSRRGKEIIIVNSDVSGSEDKGRRKRNWR